MVDRQYPRIPASLSGRLVFEDQPYAIKYVDLSRKGCRIKGVFQVVPGIPVDLFLYAPGEVTPLFIPRAMVRWSTADGIGLEFPDLTMFDQHRLDLLLTQLATRRQYPRFPASLSGRLVFEDEPYAIRFVDLSRKGCRVKGTLQIVPGRAVDLFLYLPGEVTPLFITGAMVRWSTIDGIGLEFPDLTLFDQHRLNVLVMKPKMTDNGNPNNLARSS